MGDLVALPEKDSGERPRTRTIHVFAWSAVPSGVLGDLLTTYYRTFAGTSAQPPHIARWPRAQLEGTAHQLFPESRSRELSGRFARVLADAWLSSTSDVLTELTVLVRGRLKGRHRVRGLSATTRNQKLKLVRSRLQDRRVQDALVRGFHRFYTIDEVRELPPRAETVLRRARPVARSRNQTGHGVRSSDRRSGQARRSAGWRS